MAEPYRDPNPNAPQNPPESVVNKDVRRYALWTYLPPLVVFFLGAAALLYYRGISPPQEREIVQPRVEGTAGAAGEQGRYGRTPGGHNPDPRFRSPEEEIKFRGGRP